MQYLGGKAGIGKRIAKFCELYRDPEALFVDMFCGSLNVTRHAKGPRLAVDACRPLVTMWEAALAGWVPPRIVTKEQYAAIAASPDPNDPMTAFVLFGCSFGGKWRGGYAKDRPQQRYAECASNQIVAKVRDCQGLQIMCANYREFHAGHWQPGTILYCDPPYGKTTGYTGAPPYDPADFWSWAESHARTGVKVFVSEYEAPEPWTIVDEQTAVQGGRLTPGKTPRIDRLFAIASTL
jgi:DNA adenine methylase